jgi:hypothetical protein
MKLLVAGDSFAQEPRIEDIEDNVHWCRLLASANNADVNFVGLGGGDISTTTLRAISSLMNDTYTHCIFFVTDWYRDVVHIEMRDPIKRFKQYTGNLDKFYRDIKLDYTLFGRINFRPQNKYRFTGYFNVIEPSGPSVTELSHYLQLKADYTYIHDRLSNLSLLSAVAKQLNVNLLFVDTFNNLSSLNFPFIPEMITFDYFKMMNTSHYKFYQQAENLHLRSMQSHHGIEQHENILKLFNTAYPHWLT